MSPIRSPIAQGPKGRWVASYALAFGLVAASSAVARLSGDVGPGFARVLASYAPLWLGLCVVIVGLVAGRGPAIAAALLAAVLGWYVFLPPAYSFGLDGWAAAALILFTVCSLVAALALTAPTRRAHDVSGMPRPWGNRRGTALHQRETGR